MIYLMMIDTPEEKSRFVVLYEKYRYLMMKVAMDVLKDTYTAEDVVHNAFLKVAKHMDCIGEVDSTQTKRFLITVTKRAAIDSYRKQRKRMQNEICVDEMEEENLPFTYMETEADNEILEILRNLPVTYRDVFLLKYSANLDNIQIAEICGIKEVTVRQRIARGKRIIENELRKLEGGKDEDSRGNR